MRKKLFQLLFVVSINLLSFSSVVAGINTANKKTPVQEFTLTAINFNPVDLIDSFDLFPIYEKYLGTNVQIATLKNICGEITNHYQNNGYEFAYCTLPFQKIKEGVVNLYIVEGLIGSVRLVGDVAVNDRLLNSYLNHISLNQSLDEAQLKYVEQLFSLTPGLSVKTYTKAMKDSKSLELIFEVKQEYFNGEVYVNNRGSRVVGPSQVGLSLASYSLLGSHEFLKFHLFAADNADELEYLEINSVWPVGNAGSKILVDSSYGNSIPGDFLKDANIDIDVVTASLAWLMPLILTTTENLQLTSAIDYYRSETNASGSRTALDDLYKARLSLDYVVDSERYYVRSRLTYKHGLKNLNASKAVIASSGSNLVSTGREAFSAVNFDVLYRVALTRNLFLLNQVQGQYAFDDLPVVENIVFGGEVIGTAYDQAELFGDHGLGGRIRLSYQLTDAWLASGFTLFYTQYDVAKVWNKVLDEINSLASVAVGLTIGAGSFSLDLQVAKPLTEQVLLEGNQDVRYFASARLFF